MLSLSLKLGTSGVESRSAKHYTTIYGRLKITTHINKYGVNTVSHQTSTGGKTAGA
jgi:hypothetical protein